MELPLKGIKVIELANVLAGPSVGLFLAELGATVIKIENIRSCGDVTRHWKLPSEDPATDISGYFSCVNWGKQSLAVDIAEDEGLDIIYTLAGMSDIIIASYKPGDAEKLGVDYPVLRKFNPELIYAHVTGYGTGNPRAGYDAIIQAESGFTFMNGEPEGDPVKMPVALMDVLAAHQLKEAILIALLAKERGGSGQYIEASLLKSGVASLANQAANWLVGKTIPRRLGSDHPNIVPYGTIFKTADDKEIVLAIGTDKQFRELCNLLGKPQMAKDKRYLNNQTRVANSSLLKHELQSLISTFEREDILEILQQKRVPAGGVLNMQEVFETPEAGEMLIESVQNSGTIRGVSSIAFSSDLIGTRRDLSPPPHYGQDSRAILSVYLGFDQDKIEKLIQKNIVYVRK